MELKELYIKYVLIGVYKNDRFTYARAAVVPTIKISLLSKSRAEEIRCEEKLDQEYTVYVDHVGNIIINTICVVDEIATVKGSQKTKLVFNVVNDDVLKKMACDAILGLDAVIMLNPLLFLESFT